MEEGWRNLDSPARNVLSDLLTRPSHICLDQPNFSFLVRLNACFSLDQVNIYQFILTEEQITPKDIKLFWAWRTTSLFRFFVNKMKEYKREINVYFNLRVIPRSKNRNSSAVWKIHRIRILYCTFYFILNTQSKQYFDLSF